MRLHRPIVVVRFAVLTWSVCAAVGWPQPAAVDPASASQTPVTAEGVPPAQEPAPIAPAELASRMEMDRKTLEGLRERLRENNWIDKAEKDTQSLEASIPQFEESTRALLENTPSLRVLEDQRLFWGSLQMRASGQDREIQSRWAKLRGEHEKLLRLSESWQLTGESLSLSPAERGSIAELLAQARQAEEQLQLRLDRLVGLESRVAEERKRIARLRSELEQNRDAARRNLLSQDSPPIWSLGTQSGSDFERVGRSRVETLRDYLRRESDLTARLFVLLLLLSIGLVVLRRRTRPWPSQGERLDSIGRFISRPLSGAVILTLLSFAILFPQAPPEPLYLLTLLSVVPLLRLLSDGLVDFSRGLLYATTTGNVVLIVGLWALRTPLQVRILVTLIAIGYALGLLWLLRGDSPAPFERRVALAGFALAALSVLASVFGRSNLAELLLEGCLGAIYLGFALFAAWRLLTSIGAALLLTPTAQSLRVVRVHGGMIGARIDRIAKILAVVLWLGTVLELLRLRGVLWNRVEPILGWTLSLGALEISLSRILAFAAVLWVAALLARLIRFLLREDALPRFALDRGQSYALSTLAHHIVLAVGAIAAAGAAGLSGTQLTLVAGALGVGLGFGLQDIFNNFLSGILLILERPVRVGDRVEVGELFGELVEIGLRASVMLTMEGAEVLIPNSELVSQRVVNWTLSHPRRRWRVRVGVAYGTDPRQVIGILTTAAREHPKVLEHPAPDALFLGFGESSLDFELRFWFNGHEPPWTTSSELALGVHDALKEAGIEIPFPQRDLHLRSGQLPE